MASITLRPGRWVLGFYTADKRKRSLWLGEMNKRSAATAKRHVEELVRAQKTNLRAEPDTEIWVQSLQGRLRERLVECGLVEPADPRLLTDAGRYLESFADAYIAGRTDVAANTSRNFKQAKRVLVEYFGPKHPIRTITAEDAERWRRWLLSQVVKAATETEPAKTMAPATMSMYVRRAKTMFSAAVRDQLLDSNPFTGLKTGNDSNSERLRFIDAKTSKLVLDACPDADWRLIFSLARFGGLRCPSEIAGLRWTDVDWAEDRLRINSPKTGLRFCPLFPELRTALEASWEMAVDGAVYCIANHRDVNSNLRTQFQRIIERAKVAPWPKLFQNLRASRRTELQEIYPDHVLNAWLGQSSKVAEGHYLTVTDEHWLRAASQPVSVPECSAGASIPAHPEASETTTETEITSESLGFCDFPSEEIGAGIPPARIELATRL